MGVFKGKRERQIGARVSSDNSRKCAKLRNIVLNAFSGRECKREGQKREGYVIRGNTEMQ